MSLPKMASHSFDPREALLTELRQKFPEVFTEGEIDLEKMQNFLQSKFSDDKDRYRMTWAGRKAAIQQVQVKTTDTLVPDQEQSVNFETTENVFIEGDNLEVLRVLQKSYYGNVKMIYIDPPYNTGKDFIYHDDFKQTKAQYQNKSGAVDAEGNITSVHSLVRNTKDQGHYHSDWLSMIFPRLYLAKNLLRQDGVVFVSVDDNEMPRLRILMDEIFGEENFVGQIVWKTATDNNPSRVAIEHEYLLIFIKSPETDDSWHITSTNKNLILDHYHYLHKKFKNNTLKIQEELRIFISLKAAELDQLKHYDNVDDRGVFHDGDVANTKSNGYFYKIIHPNTKKPVKSPVNGYRFPESTMRKLLAKDEIVFGKDETTVVKVKKRIEDATEKLRSVFYKDGRAATKELTTLLGVKTFNNPKDTQVIKRLINFVSVIKDHDGNIISDQIQNQDIVLDFFAGSGTTAQAVMQLNADDGGNRKWICVQLDEPCDQDSEAYKAGYKTIADIGRERIRRAGSKLQEEHKRKDLDIGFKAFHVAKSNFPVWQGSVQDEHDLIDQMDLFANAQQHDAKPVDLLYELILKEGLDINIDVQQKERASGTYYLINQGKLAISFASSITDKLMDTLFLEKPEKIILLESAFTGNDELKMNTVLHAQTLKIDIRVI